MNDAISMLGERPREIDRRARIADELEARLIASGVNAATASRAADKAFRRGPLCLAKTRKDKPCLALGDGRGDRCGLHGGASTGPRTDEGRRRALTALARYRNR